MKKFSKKKDQLDEQDYITGLDYSYILLDSYTSVMDKLMVLNNDRISRAYSKAVAAMVDLYQIIGKESNEVKRKTKRNR